MMRMMRMIDVERKHHNDYKATSKVGGSLDEFHRVSDPPEEIVINNHILITK